MRLILGMYVALGLILRPHKIQTKHICVHEYCIYREFQTNSAISSKCVRFNRLRRTLTAECIFLTTQSFYVNERKNCPG